MGEFKWSTSLSQLRKVWWCGVHFGSSKQDRETSPRQVFCAGKVYMLAAGRGSGWQGRAGSWMMMYYVQKEDLRDRSRCRKKSRLK